MKSYRTICSQSIATAECVLWDSSVTSAVFQTPGIYSWPYIQLCYSSPALSQLRPAAVPAVLLLHSLSPLLQHGSVVQLLKAVS